MVERNKKRSISETDTLGFITRIYREKKVFMITASTSSLTKRSEDQGSPYQNFNVCMSVYNLHQISMGIPDIFFTLLRKFRDDGIDLIQ
ncbi:hypothetical protein QQ008_15355 [Fulvivirgaceae bacterium BMA10]|uniref:Uncharacterized protein n=1 Tax=Splendidivirga corallicola TaxID=3051826 RepID=A0ABT8KPU4_9BACT|nr:hypothetical protein [Fulvivirgaceae bacterium BMA10]